METNTEIDPFKQADQVEGGNKSKNNQGKRTMGKESFVRTSMI